MNYLTSYKREIKSKKRVVGKKIALAIKRIDRLKNKYRFDQETANFYIDFIETFCKHFEGQFAGKKFELSLWQKVIVESTFGMLDKKGRRVTREVFVEVARKNGKSTFAAALALCMLIADGEAGAQVYSVANKLDQAKVIYKACYQMVLQSSDMQKLIRKTKVSLEFGSSVLSPLASDSKSLDGLNPHFAIYDEGHATKDNDLYDVLKSAFGMREQPLILHITTAGTVRNGVFDYLYKYSEDILNERIEDDTFLPFIYEMDSINDLDNPKNWEKANPNIGVSVFHEYLATELKRAKNNPVAKTGVYTKNFNIAQSQSKAFHSLEDIRNDETFSWSEIQGAYCIVGIDLSSTTDLTCVSWLIPYKDKLLVHQKYFLPENRLEEKELDDKQKYDVWVEKGYVELCEGSTIKTKQVVDYINSRIRDKELYVQKFCIDRWGADELERMLVESNGPLVTEVRQGAQTLSQPMKQLHGDFKDKRIVHNNNPLFIWNATNVGVKEDFNANIRPIKGNGTRSRIDGYMANLNAYTIYQSKDKSVYDYQPEIDIRRKQ